MSAILNEALAQAGKGRIPVPADEDKHPLIEGVGLEENGGMTKVPTEAQIRKWWRKHPRAELAILTGFRSNLVVVDVDGPEGEAMLARLVKLYGPLPATLEVRTKRGRHLYFQHPGEGIKILTRRGGVFWPWGKEQDPAKGFDVRGDGGLVIAPPSRDREYVNELEPVELPEKWVEPLSTSATAHANLDSEELTEALTEIRTEGEPCPCMEQALAKHDGHYPTMRDAQYQIVQLGREQHPGAGEALDRLEAGFEGTDRDWTRALGGAVASAMAGEPEVTGCPYVMKDHFEETTMTETIKEGAKGDTVTVIKGGKLTDYPGRLVLFSNIEKLGKVETKFGEKDAVKADLVVLDGDGAPIKIPGLEVTQARIVNGLSNLKSGRALGILIKNGDAWDLDTAGVTQEHVQLAKDFILREPELNEVQVQKKPDADDRFTDAVLSERVAEKVMADRFIWVPGIKWMVWDGTRWVSTEEEIVREEVRRWVRAMFDDVAGKGLTHWEDMKALKAALSRNRIAAITDLAKGMVLVRAEKLDEDPDLLNTPAGVVDLRDGTVRPPVPGLLMTMITRGAYRPGYRHEDWDKALEAVPEDIRGWFQVRSGQAATGHVVSDDIMPIFQGAGENGKTSVTSAGPVPALGDYGSVASHKLFAKGTEHSTERADLRGRRYLVAEELTEGKSIDVNALKQIIGTVRIKAHFMHRDNIEFDASHTLIVTTNHIPQIHETDHGTWRRLALVRFPFTFRKPHEELVGELDRPGDSGGPGRPPLRDRVREGLDGQHDAIVTWLVEGAMRWYADPAASLALPQRVQDDTRDWQKEADRVLGFWTEVLVPDKDHSVVAAELLNVFNRWLEENGHNTWSKETFHPRFSAHRETAKNGVVKTRPINAKGLVRAPKYLDQKNPLPAKPEVYAGLRYRDDEPAEEEEPEPFNLLDVVKVHAQHEELDRNCLVCKEIIKQEGLDPFAA